MMQFFFECGAYSGHFYQPKVNHRDFDVGVLYDKRETPAGVQVPPLLKSMLDPSEGDDFTIQTPLSCLMYEAVRVDEDETVDPSLALYTTMKCKVQVDNGLPPYLIRGRLLNHQASSVSGKSFKKLLRVFNLTWTEDDGKTPKGDDDPVLPLDWAAFFYKFKDIDTRSREGFKQFLHNYQVRGFSVDDDLSMCQIRRLFGFFLRSIVPIRCSAFDCQHRCFSMCWFSQGYFTPSITVPLRPYQELTEPYPFKLIEAIGDHQTEDREVVVLSLSSDDEESNKKRDVVEQRIEEAMNDENDIIIGECALRQAGQCNVF